MRKPHFGLPSFLSEQCVYSAFVQTNVVTTSLRGDSLRLYLDRVDTDDAHSNRRRVLMVVMAATNALAASEVASLTVITSLNTPLASAPHRSRNPLLMQLADAFTEHVLTAATGGRGAGADGTDC